MAQGGKKECSFGQVNLLEDPVYEELKMVQRVLHIDDAVESYEKKSLLPFTITNTTRIRCGVSNSCLDTYFISQNAPNDLQSPLQKISIEWINK